MEVKYRIYTLLVLLMMGVGLMEAQQVSFTVSAPSQVKQGDKFNVVYELHNAEGSNFNNPNFDGFQVLYGPSVSTSFSHQWVNGKSTSSSSQTYSYTLRAEKTGTYNIPSAAIEVDGKRYSTKPVVVEVLPSLQPSSKDNTSQDVFVRMNLSKQKAYEQEAIVCTFVLYTKSTDNYYRGPVKKATFDGFLVEEVPLSMSTYDVQSYNGQNYYVAELEKYIIFPQKTGKLTITSGEYAVTVIQLERFKTTFGMVITQPVEKNVKLHSNSASVEVLPLPEPKPASFNGAVGQFAINTEVKPNSFKTYEAATYNYIITGTGNVKYLQAPKINFPSQFDVYDPQNTVNAKPVGNSVKGTMTFEYTFIPQYVGDYEIPASEFTYFNPVTAKYETLNVSGHSLKVAKGVATGQHVVTQDLELKNKDILHIKTGAMNLKKEHVMYLSMFTYWLWYIVPIAILLAILWYYRKTIKDRANMQLLKTKRANKVAKKRLKQAKAFMSANDSSKFYAEMLKALWGYLSDKLSIPVSELNKENIISELEKYGADEAVVKDVMAVLDKCEFAQYAPDLGGNDMSEVYEEASEIMDKLENTKRK